MGGARLTFKRSDNSRSHRIAWLLDILDLNYEVKLYLRNPNTMRVLKDLMKVHPLGKVPIVEIIFADGQEPLQLVESGFIIQYLLKYYDPEFKLTPEDPRDQDKVDYFLHFSEGSMQHLLISLFVNHSARKLSPIGLKVFTKTVLKGIDNGYYLAELKLCLRYLDDTLRNNNTGFLVGNKITGADVMLSFPIYENIFDNLEQAHKITDEKKNLCEKYPHLAAWASRISNDPCYKKVTKLMQDKVAAQTKSTGKQRRNLNGI